MVGNPLEHDHFLESLEMFEGLRACFMSFIIFDFGWFLEETA